MLMTNNILSFYINNLTLLGKIKEKHMKKIFKKYKLCYKIFVIYI